MDLDGDGIPDIITGSWPGELYFFRGLGKGNFAPGEKLKDKEGKIIRLGSASTVFAVDWNGDGKLDLLVGDQQGQVHLVLNEGTAKKYAFGPAAKLEVDGKPIRVPHGDSGPVAADWDGDGKLHLIVGAGDGSVLLYRNLGTKKEHKLASPVTLVAAAPNRGNEKDATPGSRAKVCVVDWNGDGKLDLLVGDYGHEKFDRSKQTPEERKAEEAARKKLPDLLAQRNELDKEMRLLLVVKETPEAQKERRAKLEKLQDKMKELSTAQREAMQERLKFDKLAGNAKSEAYKKAIQDAQAEARVAHDKSFEMQKIVTELQRKVALADADEVQSHQAELAKAQKTLEEARSKAMEASRASMRAQRPDLSNLSPEDRKAAEAARAKEDAAQKAYQDFQDKEYRPAMTPVETPEAAKERQAKLAKVRQRMDAVTAQATQAQEILRRYDMPQIVGSVWLFLRK